MAIRARPVHDTEYQRMGRERDQRHHRVQAAAVVAGHTAPGPVLSLLRSYGLVRGLVFGAYAEASPDVHALLSHTASLEARRSWEEIGARGYQEARARVSAAMYADWDMAAARAAARMRLARVRFIGLTCAQLQVVAGAGGPRRPAAAEAVVGDYCNTPWTHGTGHFHASCGRGCPRGLRRLSCRCSARATAALSFAAMIALRSSVAYV